MRRILLTLVCCLGLVWPANAQVTLQPNFFGMDLASTPPKNPIPLTYTISKILGGVWNTVETCRPADPNNQSDPCWNWSGLDSGVALCAAIGVDCDFIIFIDAPAWSQAVPDTAAPPDDLQDLYNYGTTLATRYAGRIHRYEIANEMSLSSWYSGSLATLVTFSNQLCTLVHAADPKALVFSPSTFFITGEQYFANYLAAGGAVCDGVGLHPYPIFSVPGSYNPSGAVPPEENWNTVQFYTALFQQFGLGGGNLMLSEGGQTLSTYDIAANGSIWLLQMTGFAPNFKTRVMPYAWNAVPGRSTNFVDAFGNINAQGQAYTQTESWLIGSTVTQVPTRTRGTNGIRNPNGTGFVAGLPGTPPTNWSLVAGDVTHGISTEIVGACTNNGVAGVAWHIFGTATAGAAGFTKLWLEVQNQIPATQSQWWTRGGTASLIAGSLTNLTVVNNWAEQSLNGTSSNTTAGTLNARIIPIATPVAQQYAIQTIEPYTQYVRPSFGTNYTVGNPINATFCLTDQFMDTGNQWTMQITRPGGYQAEILWAANYSGPVPFTVSAPFAYQRDVTGGSGPIVNNTVILTGRPILIENQPHMIWPN